MSRSQVSVVQATVLGFFYTFGLQALKAPLMAGVAAIGSEILVTDKTWQNKNGAPTIDTGKVAVAALVGTLCVMSLVDMITFTATVGSFNRTKNVVRVISALFTANLLLLGPVAAVGGAINKDSEKDLGNMMLAGLVGGVSFFGVLALIAAGIYAGCFSDSTSSDGQSRRRAYYSYPVPAVPAAQAAPVFSTTEPAASIVVPVVSAAEPIATQGGNPRTFYSIAYGRSDSSQREENNTTVSPETYWMDSSSSNTP